MKQKLDITPADEAPIYEEPQTRDGNFSRFYDWANGSDWQDGPVKNIGESRATGWGDFIKPGVLSDEEKANTEAHDKEVLENVEQLALKLRDDIETVDSEGQFYKIIRDYISRRREIMLAYLAGESCEEKMAFVSFEALRETAACTSSVYVKRLIEWGMMHEVHEVVSWGDFEVDYKVSRPEALEVWRQDGSFLPSDAAKGLKWKISPDREQYLETHPEYREMYNFANDALTEFPGLGDNDFYAPDPYINMNVDINSIHEHSKIPRDEVELAIETANLFGVGIDDISDEARVQLFRVGVSLEGADYSRIKSLVAKIPQILRNSLAEAFLAIEFGEDFSDILLSLAENMKSEELVLLLEKVRFVREQAHRYADGFVGFDPELAGAIRRAAAERITEALYVAREIATSDRHRASARVLGGRITVESYDEVMDTLKLIEKGFAKYNAAVDSKNFNIAYESESSVGIYLGENHDVLAQCKPYGTPKGEYMHGVEHSEEGQFNVSVNVLGEDEMPYEIRDYQRRYGLSIRLDLEGIIRDQNGGKVDFDATRDQLIVSLDIGSLRGATDNPNVRVARIISLGNKLRRKNLQQGRSRGYHTPLASRYGEKERFASMVGYMYTRLTGETLSIPLGAARFGQNVLRLHVSPEEKFAA